jgi:hypothetical protein
VNEIVEASSVRVLAPLPEPRVAIAVRPGTMDDIPFIDALQKKHAKQVGFMPAKQLAGKIDAGHVLVAEANASADFADSADLKDEDEAHLNLRPSAQSADQRLGYVIGTDRYFKREDVGIIYHLNVAPGRQRGFVGATLLRAMFDGAAYGCRLFCCWCAQDIEANHFWESMGFVPLAYRAGSEKKSRVHIFWQKRIRAGDNETPWWFPSQTTGGSIREDRLVLPIPPGTHWSDAKPIVLPGAEEPKQIEGPKPKRDRKPAPAPARPSARTLGAPRLVGVSSPPAAAAELAKARAKGRERKPRRKNDPKLVAAARELRDRWLEQVNAGEYSLEAAGKYDVVRALPAAPSSLKALPHAA